MPLIDRIQQARTKAQPAPRWALGTADAQSHAMPDYSLAQNQAGLYQRLSWVNAAINAVARSCALLPFNVYELAGTKKQDIENHPFETLMARPNPLMSRYQLLLATVAYRKLTGNAYWWLNRVGEGSPPSEIWLLPSNKIVPVPDGKLYLKGYLYEPGNGQKVPLEPSEVVHFRGFHPANEFIGASDIEALSYTAESDYKQQQWNRNFFSEDNAKFPGVLAFSDPIPDTPWEQIQSDFKAQGGGTKRQSMRMLRNVGPGGVQWIQTNISQRDMEFLAGRQFNKEEIWAVLAPGLVSMLDANATEANSTAGRKTFMELAIWPELVSMAETLTNGLLPAYGDNLWGEFEDPRVTDRMLELEERQVWQTVHTVDEVREHFDGDAPIGDERGALLVPQLAQLPGRPDVAPEGPEPGALNTADQAPQDEPPNEEEPDGPDNVKTAREAELATWRRYAAKHGATKAATFSPDHLPTDVAAVIKARLAAATDDEEVHAAFSGPFLIKAERVTDDGLADPLGAFKDGAEARLMRILKRRLNGQLNEVLNLLGEPPDINNLSGDFWETQAGQMLAEVRPELERLAQDAGWQMVESLNVGVDWTLVNEAAADWAQSYTYELVRGVNDTTRTVLQKRVSAFYRDPNVTRGDLERALAPYFGEKRAESIAVTEVTRAAYEGQQASVAEARRLGFNLEDVWHTNRDDKVCSVCAPNDGKRRSQGWTVDKAPAHVRCRCWVTQQWVGEVG